MYGIHIKIIEVRGVIKVGNARLAYNIGEENT